MFGLGVWAGRLGWMFGRSVWTEHLILQLTTNPSCGNVRTDTKVQNEMTRLKFILLKIYLPKLYGHDGAGRTEPVDRVPTNPAYIDFARDFAKFRDPQQTLMQPHCPEDRPRRRWFTLDAGCR